MDGVIANAKAVSVFPEMESVAGDVVAFYRDEKCADTDIPLIGRNML